METLDNRRIETRQEPGGPAGKGCPMTCEEKKALLREIRVCTFALIEANLFLDTHPDDAAAMKNMATYQKAACQLMEEFEKTYGPLTARDLYGDTRFEWLNSPWPWDLDKEADA